MASSKQETTMSIQLTVGKVYAVRHSSGTIRAQFLSEILRRSYHRANTHYAFKNLGTGRTIELKSKAKIIKEVS
jgi:hypothetical protein